jgi:hypothetical protein
MEIGSGNMANKKNQHYVPQSYFRCFSENRPCINVLLKESGKIIHNASIKGQCSEDNFYGCRDNEELMTIMELDVKHILDDFRKVKNNKDLQELYSSNHFSKIYIAILLQRTRTELETQKMKFRVDGLVNEYLKDAIRLDKNAHKLLKDNVDSLNFEYPHEYYVGLHMQNIYPGCHYLTDLGIHVLKNKTRIPFIFGDSPVVFYNQYYRNVTSRGVLGFSTPGLMIFYPLSTDTILLLLDETVYECPWKDDCVYEVTEEFDIKHLNKLQLHNAYKSIYFTNSMPEKVVSRYWKQEKSSLKPIMNGFSKRPMLVDGKLVEDVMVGTEHHIPYFLQLSFIQSEIIEDHEYKFRRRDQDLHEFVKELEQNKEERLTKLYHQNK